MVAIEYDPVASTLFMCLCSSSLQFKNLYRWILSNVRFEYSNPFGVYDCIQTAFQKEIHTHEALNEMNVANNLIEYVSMASFIFARKINGHPAATFGVVIRITFLSVFPLLFFTKFTITTSIRLHIYAAVRSQQITVNGIWQWSFSELFNSFTHCFIIVFHFYFFRRFGEQEKMTSGLWVLCLVSDRIMTPANDL